MTTDVPGTCYGEAMKARTRTKDRSPEGWEEVDGYVELGMEKEALKAGLRILRKGLPDAATMYGVVVNLLSIMGTPSPAIKKACREAMDLAVNALTKAEQEEGWGWAMVFFASLDMKRDGLEALKKLKNIPEEPLQVAMALDLVRGQRYQALKAKLLAQGKTLLARGVEPPTDELLQEALASAERKYLK